MRLVRATKMATARYGSSACRVLLFLLLVWCCLQEVYPKKKLPKLEISTESRPDDCSTTAVEGDTLSVHYTGAFTNGKVFDSSKGREPFTIQLGAKQVIPGWEQGLVGMCEGEVRKLVIPPHLAYGDRGIEGAIPGGATLLFTVELLELKKPSAVPVNRDTITLLGFVGLVGLLIFEAVRRWKKEDEDMKLQKKAAKKGSKKKR